jgi:hypothetical protein
MLFEVIDSTEVDKSTGIIADEQILLTGLRPQAGILKKSGW